MGVPQGQDLSTVGPLSLAAVDAADEMVLDGMAGVCVMLGQADGEAAGTADADGDGNGDAEPPIGVCAIAPGLHAAATPTPMSSEQASSGHTTTTT